MCQLCQESDQSSPTMFLSSPLFLTLGSINLNVCRFKIKTSRQFKWLFSAQPNEGRDSMGTVFSSRPYRFLQIAYLPLNSAKLVCVEPGAINKHQSVDAKQSNYNSWPTRTDCCLFRTKKKVGLFYMYSYLLQWRGKDRNKELQGNRITDWHMAITNETN